MTELAKTHILFPKPLLRQIDRIAGFGRRSQFIIDAARDKLDRLHFLGALKRTSGTWQTANHPSLKSQSHINQLLKKLRRQTGSRLRHHLHDN